MIQQASGPTGTMVESAADRRQADRRQCGLYARLQIGGKGSPRFPAWVTDMSSGGATVLSREDLSVGRLTLELHLGDFAVPVPIVIQNRQCIDDEYSAGTLYRYGVSFAPRVNPDDSQHVLADLL
jgi:hypothetical protein